MTLQEAIDQIKVITGFRRDLDAQIVKQLKFAQANLEQGPTMPWFLLSEVSTNVTTVNGRRILIPDDFIREYEDGALWFAPSGEDEIALEKADNDELMRIFGTVAEGQPQAYSLDGKYFKIYPLPDDVYTVKLLYYRHDTPMDQVQLSDSSLWLANAPDCIIGRAGSVLASGLRDKDAMDRFTSMEAQGRVAMYNENEARKHANRSYQIGGPEV